MCDAPSTWRAKMWLIEPRFFRAEYSGLIAAPGTPHAQTTPSFSRIRTEASIARLFAISHPAHFVLVRVRSSRGERVTSMRLNLFPAVWNESRKIHDIRRLGGFENERFRACIVERAYAICGSPGDDVAISGFFAQEAFASGIAPLSALVSSAATSCTSFPRTGKRSCGTREALPETEMAARGSLRSS